MIVRKRKGEVKTSPNKSAHLKSFEKRNPQFRVDYPVGYKPIDYIKPLPFKIPFPHLNEFK